MALYRSAETAATVTLPDHSLEPTSRQSLGRRSWARLVTREGPPCEFHLGYIPAPHLLAIPNVTSNTRWCPTRAGPRWPARLGKRI
jgi:hypothetical protein